MGTNYYIKTKNKELAEKATGGDYKITDTIDFGYEIHVAKTSCGWLPLFQGYKNGIKSVKEYKELYDTDECIMYDEYDEMLGWHEFEHDVLQHNGGKLGVLEPEKYNDAYGFDKCMPEYIPVSHIPGTKQSYKFDRRYVDPNIEYFADNEGYEFCLVEFS